MDFSRLIGFPSYKLHRSFKTTVTTRFWGTTPPKPPSHHLTKIKEEGPNVKRDLRWHHIVIGCGLLIHQFEGGPPRCFFSPLHLQEKSETNDVEVSNPEIVGKDEIEG